MPPNDNNKRAAFEAMKKIREKYGDHSISTAAELAEFEIVPSGSLCLDYITEIGGFPSNRIVELAGDPGSGKSTLAMHAMNNALKKYTDRIGVFMDFEQKITKPWMENFIEDMDRVLVLNPDHIEQGTDMFREFSKTGEVCCCVVDSIGGAPSRRATEKSSETANYGGNSVGVTEFARFAATMGGKYNILTIGINQVRADMEGFRRLITPGGQGWKHACSLRIQLKRGPDKYEEKQSNGEVIQVGYDVILKTVKSGVGTPFRATKYRFYSTRSQSGAFGVDRTDEVMRLARLSETVAKRGGWYYHPALPGGKINGEAALLNYAIASPAFVDEIEKQIRAKISKGEAIRGAAVTFDEDYAERDDNGLLARKLEVELDADEDDGDE